VTAFDNFLNNVQGGTLHNAKTKPLERANQLELKVRLVFPKKKLKG